MKPLLLDLFCGAGGAAMGYSRAGFEVIGCDVNPQPRYPFRMWQKSVLDLFFWEGGCEGLPFVAIHASPPCQAYNQLSTDGHPRLIEPVRELLEATGLPYVIENIPAAPLRGPAILCGSSFGLGVRRHRAFETNWPLMSPPCAHGAQASNPHRMRAGYEPPANAIVPVYGGGQAGFTIDACRKAMGIDWMMTGELNEAIPPAYTEMIGHQLIAHVSRASGEAKIPRPPTADAESSQTIGGVS